MQLYLDLLRDVLEHGITRQDRTGVGTLSVFGRQLRFDLRHGFPLLTTKKLHWHSIVHELLWFLRGDTNIAYLHQHDVHIWDEWANETGDLGPIYGRQWRCWPSPNGKTIDQIERLIEGLRHDTHSRRLLVSSWNVGELDEMQLLPCHVLFQCYVVDGVLSCQLYQRSADLFLGVPFNIASYALLMHLLAAVTGLTVGEFVHTFGDAHIYLNHRQQVNEQLQRQPLSLPTLTLNIPPSNLDISRIRAENIVLQHYHPHPNIKAPIAV